MGRNSSHLLKGLGPKEAHVSSDTILLGESKSRGYTSLMEGWTKVVPGEEATLQLQLWTREEENGSGCGTCHLCSVPMWQKVAQQWEVYFLLLIHTQQSGFCLTRIPENTVLHQHLGVTRPTRMAAPAWGWILCSGRGTCGRWSASTVSARVSKRGLDVGGRRTSLHATWKSRSWAPMRERPQGQASETIITAPLGAPRREDKCKEQNWTDEA